MQSVPIYLFFASRGMGFRLVRNGLHLLSLIPAILPPLPCAAGNRASRKNKTQINTDGEKERRDEDAR